MQKWTALPRLVSGGLGAGLVVVGWALTAEALYVLGIVTVGVVILTTARFPAKRIQRAGVVVLAVTLLVVGIGLPIHIARSELTADRLIELDRGQEYRLQVATDARTTTRPLGDGASLVRSPEYLRRINTRTATEEWAVPIRGGRLTPAVDGAVVQSDSGLITRITPSGDEAWQEQVPAGGIQDARAVAAAVGGTVVVQACEPPEDPDARPYREPCRFIGYAPDGTVAFEHERLEGGGRILEAARDSLGFLDGTLPTVYLTTGPAGEREIRSASDGSVLERLGPTSESETTLAIVGDTLLVPRQDAGGCSITGYREGSEVWRAEVSCWGGDVSAPLLHHNTVVPGSRLIGDRLWIYRDDELGADTLNSRTGAARDAGLVRDILATGTQPATAGVPGPTAIAHLDGNSLSVAGADDGATLWQTTVRGEVQNVWVMASAVTVHTHSPSQLLFGSRESADRLTVYDLDSGSVRDELLVNADELEQIIPLSDGLMVVRDGDEEVWHGALVG